MARPRGPQHHGGRLRRDQPLEPLDAAYDPPVDPPVPERDDELRLIFLCCDPALGRAAQLALVLNVAFGLSAHQIAVAFVSDERTVAQRIVRGKQRLREAGVLFDIPEAIALPGRLGPILDVLYIVFSEGYNPTDDAVFDAGLCTEALRLVRLLTETPQTAVPAAFALRALLCFHASRLPARLADDGGLLLMPEQDRARWDASLLSEAFWCLNDAGSGSEVTRFHLEAAIAACHAMGSSYATTDWLRIVDLYDMLRAQAPSLVIDVNRALAIAMRSGARIGLDELDAIPEREILARYPYALAAYADLHASLGHLDEVRAYLDRALQHQAAPAQLALLRRKRASLDAHAPPLYGMDDDGEVVADLGLRLERYWTRMLDAFKARAEAFDGEAGAEE
jgi:predicted RNA polymerase sigma factor